MENLLSMFTIYHMYTNLEKSATPHVNCRHLLLQHLRQSVSPQRRQSHLVKSAMETKSPIKLRKYQFNEQFNNIVVNNNTVIQNYTKSLDFKPSETLQPQLITINTINLISPQQLVSFKAKVTQLTGPKTQIGRASCRERV